MVSLKTIFVSIIVLLSLGGVGYLAYIGYKKYGSKPALTQRYNSVGVPSVGETSEPGYGVNYHIVGGKKYAGNNDPNDLYTVANDFDDYRMWHSAKVGHKDFEVNPVYSADGEDNGHCSVTRHHNAHNPSSYNELHHGCY